MTLLSPPNFSWLKNTKKMFPLPNFFGLLIKYNNRHHNKKIELKTASVSGLFALSFFVNISLMITPRSLIFYCY